MKIAGGNSTALVSNCPRELKNQVSKELLKKVEQVDFISSKNGIPKLELMGGELCINGTLAFASQLENKQGKIFTSGITEGIDYENSGEKTKIKIPLDYQRFDKVILFGGIGFICINKKDGEKTSKEFLLEMSNKYNKPAFGVIIYNQNK